MSTYARWMNAGLDGWMLGVEAGAVIGLRMAKVAAGGDAAASELWRMAAEKVGSAVEVQTKTMTGGMGYTPLAQTQGLLRHYRTKVRANLNRLSRERR